MVAGPDMLRLQVTPHSDKFDPQDESWVEQERQLFTELRSDVGGVELHAAPVRGEKGAVETVIVALATAGAFNAAFDCLTAWLARDRTRGIEIVFTVDGREERFMMAGDRVDDAALERLTAVAMTQLDRTR